MFMSQLGRDFHVGSDKAQHAQTWRPPPIFLALLTRLTHTKFQTSEGKTPRAGKKKHMLPLGAKRSKSAVSNSRNLIPVRVIIARLNQRGRGAEGRPQTKSQANLKFDVAIIKVSRI